MLLELRLAVHRVETGEPLLRHRDRDLLRVRVRRQKRREEQGVGGMKGRLWDAGSLGGRGLVQAWRRRRGRWAAPLLLILPKLTTTHMSESLARLEYLDLGLQELRPEGFRVFGGRQTRESIVYARGSLARENTDEIYYY